MQQFLPDQILAKSKHGFGLPFGDWLKTSKLLADLVYESLNGLKKRELIEPRFIDELISDHQQGHAGYFGYIIWDLVMLEQWFTVHIDA